MNDDISNDLALYVHWPWCKAKCPYCDFNSHVAAQIDENAYISSLITDLETQRKQTGTRQLVSIFFGGGTPSLMQPESVKRILTAAEALYTFHPNIEITLEANPTSSDRAKFDAFHKAGINRLSIGVQSLNNNDLAFLGREHSAKEALDVVRAGQAIFPRINVDVIYGLPNQHLSDWEAMLDTIIDLKTTHVSAYQLTIEKNTQFYAKFNKGLLTPLSDDNQLLFFNKTREIFEKNGFLNYEISNFARPNAICAHNQHVWRYGDYLGIGAGAHGRYHTIKGDFFHVINKKIPEKYMAYTLEKGHGQHEKTLINLDQSAEEALMMGLRLAEGVSPDHHLMSDLLKQDCVHKLMDQGFLHTKNRHICLTNKGWPLLDSVLLALLPD